MVLAEIERELARATQLQRSGQGVAAATIYRQILKKNGNIAPAHYNLALLLKDEGRALAAEKSFNAALKIDPGYRLAWGAYARFLGMRGRYRDAIRAGLKLAALDDFSGATLQELADLVELAGDIDLGTPGDEAMALCLGRADVESDRMILALLARLRRHTAFKNLLASGATREAVTSVLADPPARDKLFTAIREPLVAAAFANLILPIPEMELLLACCREALAETGAEENLEVMALLALQMELAEYVLEAGPAPTAGKELKSALVAALYSPLLPEIADEILEKEGAALAVLPWCRLLLIRMGPEKLREWELAATLPTLSRSGDAVSRSVQEHYEESPYPRWRGLRSGGETTLAALVKSLFPAMNLPAAVSPKVLIAGCGTGRHALRTARRIRGSVVTAIDLSRTSLAYGARQAEALEVANVTFNEADLVDLPDSLGTFDLIEACGVLHHMADPEAAWKGLLNFLAPGGLMKVALYSEQARRDVVAVHEIVGERINSLTLDEMRSLRRELLDLPGDHPAKPVTKELDFYSLSGCRDLVFNRNEQRFDIPRIEAAIQGLGLDFLGFEFTKSRVLEAYHARHSDDPTGRNLANWAKIEAENPALFRGMYQFWCRVKK